MHMIKTLVNFMNCVEIDTTNFNKNENEKLEWASLVLRILILASENDKRRMH